MHDHDWEMWNVGRYFFHLIWVIYSNVIVETLAAGELRLLKFQMSFFQAAGANGFNRKKINTVKYRRMNFTVLCRKQGEKRTILSQSGIEYLFWKRNSSSVAFRRRILRCDSTRHCWETNYFQFYLDYNNINKYHKADLVKCLRPFPVFCFEIHWFHL